MAPLEKDAAIELITEPLKSIGIQYKNERDVKHILEYTGNHPNLLQFICKHLVEKVEKHSKIEDKRVIFRKDIEELFDAKYQDYIIDEIYMFFSDLTDLDKLIIIVLAEKHPNMKIFSTEEIRSILYESGVNISINEVHKNLRNLVMRFILLDRGRNKYGFALTSFPEMIKGRVDVHLKNDLVKEVVNSV